MARDREEYRFEPIDTNPDVAVGVGLPFAGRNNVFHLNYTTEQQAISNLKNLLLTRKGERVMQPNFGWVGWHLLFEPNDELLKPKLITGTTQDVAVWLPYIQIDSIDITAEENVVRMSMKIKIEPSLANKTITLEISQGAGPIITEE